MKNLFLFFLTLFFLWACDSKPSQEVEIEAELNDIFDSLRVVPDPDPTDQIAGDQYLIDASSAQTADLVRDRLTQLHAEDLKINVVDSLSRKFIFFEFDLNGDGSKEIFVGLTGPYFCGSGGCTQFLLNAKGEVISKFTVSDYPVVVSTERTNGWFDLYMQSAGDFRILKFDGKTYPGNPSILPKSETIPGDGLPRALDFMNDNYPWFRF